MAKIEQWMRDAAKQALDAVHSDGEIWIDVPKLAAIIASHAPSEAAVNEGQGFKVVDEWGPRELEASPSPWQNRSEVAAQPTEDVIDAAEFEAVERAADLESEIEHNDH